MTEPAIRRRSLAGRLLIVAGVALFSYWAYYFLDLVRERDAWDFVPLPVALAAILIGVKLAQLNGRILAMIGVSFKRDLAVATVIGTLVEIILWALISRDPEIAARFIHLELIQKFALRIAMAVYRYSYFRIGNPGSRYLASVGGFAILIAIWSSGAFVLLRIFWFLRNASSRVRQEPRT